MEAKGSGRGISRVILALLLLFLCLVGLRLICIG